MNEFFVLAGTWLACRWEVIHGEFLNGNTPFDLRYPLLGEHDYWREMELLVREELERIKCQQNRLVNMA